MKFESHLIFSSVAAVSTPFIAKGIGINLGFNDLIFIIPSIVLGGIFPDCDIKSKAQKYYGIGLLILFVYWFFMMTSEYIFIPLIPFLLAVISKHRGWTHSWLMPIAIVSFVILANYNAWFSYDLTVKYSLPMIGFALGILVHLFADIKKIKKIVRFIFGDKAVKLLYE